MRVFEKTFPNGGTVYNLWVPDYEAFLQELETARTEKGKLYLTIARKKNASDYYVTYYDDSVEESSDDKSSDAFPSF